MKISADQIQPVLIKEGGGYTLCDKLNPVSVICTEQLCDFYTSTHLPTDIRAEQPSHQWSLIAHSLYNTSVNVTAVNFTDPNKSCTEQLLFACIVVYYTLFSIERITQVLEHQGVKNTFC